MRTFKINQYQDLSRNRWIDYKQFHSLRRKFKKLQYIGRDNKFNPKLSREQEDLGYVIKFTKSNRPYLPANSNRELIKQLGELGFFDIYSTNCASEEKGFGVYVSQVVMFLEYGIEWIRTGFKMPAHLMEIHHCSSNVLDNRLRNLEVVTKTAHCLLTNLQMGQNHSYSPIRDFDRTDNPIPTNKGKWLTSFKDVGSRLGQLIKKTLDMTINWLKQSLALAVKKGKTFSSELDKLIADIAPDFLNSEYYVPLDESEEKAVMALSLNWLIGKAIPDIGTIYKNLKGTASVFMKSVFHKADADDIFKALVNGV